MANYHAVYIDSPSSWTYAPDSYDSKLGFYTNAWLTNQTEEESETPVISCSYFYEIGKEDDVGFTPRRINYNSSSGILTVEGKQSGVPSLVSKSFRKKSPSPRFLNLRESLRKRRPARFMVSQIITDDNDSLENIKKYLGIDEKGEEKSAEGIGSILGNVIPEPHFVGYEEIKKEKMKNQNMKDAEEFGAESRRESWFDTNYENFGNSKRRVRITPSDYNMKCVDCGRRMSCIGPYTPNDERSSPSNDFYAVWCSTCRETRFSAEEFGADTADVDFDEAYMERQDAERIMKLLRIVKRKATGSNARYAKTYADAAEMAYYDYGFKGLKTQVAYVLSNLGGWRGDEAKQVKAELRKLMR